MLLGKVKICCNAESRDMAAEHNSYVAVDGLVLNWYTTAVGSESTYDDD